MSNERTFAIIKPNAVQAGRVGQILSEIERAALTLRGMRLARLTPEICKEFYQEHVGKAFYPTLEAFMVEGPVVLLCLEGENAIVRWRDIMGATDPAKAAEGTLRARFGESITRNATHGSDSPASAQRELGFFFGAYDLV
jgi:nucleoside-diphosphate kinase